MPQMTPGRVKREKAKPTRSTGKTFVTLEGATWPPRRTEPVVPGRFVMRGGVLKPFEQTRAAASPAIIPDNFKGGAYFDPQLNRTVECRSQVKREVSEHNARRSEKDSKWRIA